IISHEVTTRVADGMACRTPLEEALEIARRGISRVALVSDESIETAIRALFADTHNTAEGAGAVALAALLQERDEMRGREVAVVLTGGNIDTRRFSNILASV
ncbi:MAG: pyridoxal-phosphate dependent enzyme, partial [Gemmatimonadaceae bacterium]